MRHLGGEVPGLHFVNADLIAAGLSPLDRGTGVEAAAGRLMLAQINRLAVQGRSFAFETTLAGRSYLRRIDRWRRDGYRVVLVYLSLGSPEDAVRRVAERVRQGGHPVPEDVLRRRFDAGLRNLREHYMGRADEWKTLDNTGPVPLLAEQGMNLTEPSDIDQEGPCRPSSCLARRGADRIHLAITEASRQEGASCSVSNRDGRRDATQRQGGGRASRPSHVRRPHPATLPSERLETLPEARQHFRGLV